MGLGLGVDAESRGVDDGGMDRLTEAATPAGA